MPHRFAALAQHLLGLTPALSIEGIELSTTGRSPVARAFSRIGGLSGAGRLG